MVAALFDTNILLDHLKAVPAAKREIVRYEDIAISIVTRMEVLVGAEPESETATRKFLDSFKTVPLDDAVAEQAIILRRRHRLKLSDAIIWASAIVQGRLLVTRDTKDFPANDPGVRTPYKL